MINTFFRNVLDQKDLRCYFGIKVDGIEAIGLYSCRKFSHGHGDFRLDDE